MSVRPAGSATGTILRTLLSDLGDAAGSRPRETASPEAWIDAAGGRAAWECWGKAQPSGGCPAHPILCHMLDVAAVAARLLTTHSPRALRRRLLAVVPEDEPASLRLLLFVVALHDIGKFTPAFQSKTDWARRLLPLRGFDLDPPPRARHHGAAGLVFARDALRTLGISPPDALALARAVTAHHGEFPRDETLTREPMGSRERGRTPRWEEARHDAVESLRSFVGLNSLATSRIEHSYVVQLAGLTAVADWIGSMEDVFTYEPPQDSLAAYWPSAMLRADVALDRAGMRECVETPPGTFRTLFPQYTAWPLHVATESVASTLSSPSLVIVEAPMGEGKTESALLVANAVAARLGQHGLYIGLPTKATANQMIGRVRSFLEAVGPGDRSTLVLAHGDAETVGEFSGLVAVYDEDKWNASGVRAETWFLSRKRTLLAEHAVGTIDQALLGVLHARHAFVRLFGMAGKTVILDEVHAYDTFTSTILERLVEWLAAMGTTVVLLSATLPRVKRQWLANAYRRGLGTHAGAPGPAVPYPRLTTVHQDGSSASHVTPRGGSVTIALRRVDDDLAIIAHGLVEQVRSGGCAGWICNTVDRAQAACEALGRVGGNIPRLLLHARMLPDERSAREQRLEAMLGPEHRALHRPLRCIVVGTQILEQSLDVDFDLLVTDLAPIDLLLQRSGRLHRHRDRRNRAAGHPSPHLWVVHSEGPFDRVPLASVAAVYDEAVVRETLRALDGRSQITLPDDIEDLVERVYGLPLPAAEDALYDAHIRHVGRDIAKRQNAEGRLFPRPTSNDDIFASLRTPFADDDDPEVHEELRAITRDAEPSVQVVCLVGRSNGVFVTERDDVPLVLGMKPDRVLAARLARRTINVSHKRVVHGILADVSLRPAEWGDDALLRHRCRVVFTDGVALVGDSRLELDPELGLRIGEPASGFKP